MTIDVQQATVTPARAKEKAKTPPVDWGVTFPDDEQVRMYRRDSLTNACQGNERMGNLLNYFLYQASKERELQGLPKGCKVVTFTRKHEEIQKRLTFNLSEKSLITYCHKFKEWGFVDSEKYQKVYTVHFDATQKAINDPPAPVERKPRTQKGCKVVKVQPSEREVELAKKVEDLQQKVELLQEKVETLQPISCNSSTFQPALRLLVEWLQGHFPDDSILLSISSLLQSIGKVSDDVPLAQGIEDEPTEEQQRWREDTAAKLKAMKAQSQGDTLEDEPPITEIDPEETVTKINDPDRQPFNVSANSSMPLCPIATNGYSPTDHAEPTNDGASPPVPGVANGYMNQPAPEGDTHDGQQHRERPDNPVGSDTHDRPDVLCDQRRLTQGDTPHVEPLATRPDCDATYGGDLPARAASVVAVDSRDVCAGGAGIRDVAPGLGMVLTADTALSPSVAPVIPPDGRQQTQGGATPASPIESGSRAPGREDEVARSQAGETYSTVEAWQAARDAYSATLPPLWEALDMAARKQQYGNRFDRYRAAMLKAWEATHAKPALLRLLEPELTPEQQARCKAWYQRFIDYRGYEWTTQGQCINERKYIKLLVAKYSDAQIAVLHDYLFNRHFKWSKPDFRYKIGAYEVYTEAPSVIQILKAEKLHGNGGTNGTGYSKPAQSVPGYAKSNERMRLEREKYAVGGK